MAACSDSYLSADVQAMTMVTVEHFVDFERFLLTTIVDVPAMSISARKTISKLKTVRIQEKWKRNSLQLAMAVDKQYSLVISVAFRSMAGHLDSEMCRLWVVAADGLSHKPLIWCAVDRAPWLGLVYVVATLTQRAFDLLQSIPGENRRNLQFE